MGGSLMRGPLHERDYPVARAGAQEHPVKTLKMTNNQW
jgi:hypothetical protein